MDPLVTSIHSANPCKVLHNFVNICIRKQNFAELTPVHHLGAIQFSQLFARLIFGTKAVSRFESGSLRQQSPSRVVGLADAFVGSHVAALLAPGRGLVMSVVAAAAGAVVVLFAWGLAK